SSGCFRQATSPNATRALGKAATSNFLRGTILLHLQLPEYLRNLAKGAARMLYHVIVITLSAGIALSLPFAAGVFAENFAAYWAIVANEKIVLISMEIAV